MRVLLSTYGSRGDVEPMVGLAVQLQAVGAEVVLCAPPDCAERLTEVGVPHVPVGLSVQQLVHGPKPSVPDVRQIAGALIAEWFDKVSPVAEGCDALVATGLLPTAVAARSVAEKVGIYSVHAGYCPLYLPSPHHRPQPLPGRPIPPDVTDQHELNELDVQNYNAFVGEPLNTHRAAVGLPPVDDVRAHFLGDRPWLAADPILALWPGSTEVEVVQTGAWITPDERPLPADVESFLDAGAPPVYVGFGSMPAPESFARMAIETIRAQGCRVVVSRGWADLALVDDRDDCCVVGEVNQQALFRRVAAVVHHGGAGTTTTATRAGAPQIVVPQIGDQPYWASRVAALGVGVAHDGPTPTAESLSAALTTALSLDVRARATAVAGTIRSDGAAVAARLLVEAVSRERTPMST